MSTPDPILASKILTISSKACGESGGWCQDTFGHRRGGVGCVSPPQVCPWLCQRARQTLWGEAVPYRHYLWFTLSQEYKDVKEKVDQLVPWLTRLKDNIAVVATGVDPEEEKRREELSR